MKISVKIRFRFLPLACFSVLPNPYREWIMKRESGLMPELYPQLYALFKNFLIYYATVCRKTDGKVIKRKASQNTCRDSLNYILLSGKIAKVNSNSLSFIFSIQKKAGKLKRKQSVMEKVCPRCRESFVCRNDRIEECWCISEPLSSGFRRFISDQFLDCLCVKCIAGLRKNFINYEQQLNLENEKK